MNNIDWIGFIGVFQILLAYALNVMGKITHKSLTYILLNFIGSAMASIASILLNYWPFIILEGIWCVVSATSLFTYLKSYSAKS